MTFPPEYHTNVKRPVQRSVPPSPALFITLLLPLLLVSTSPAQISATSNASNSAHSISVSPPSISVAPFTGSVAPPTAGFGHNGFVPANSGVTFSGHSPSSTNGSHGNHAHHQHRTANGDVYYPYLYAVPVPYTADVNDADTDDEDDSEYQGGPTVFDRRGSGAASYVPPSYPGPAHGQAQSAPAGPMPAEDAPAEPPQPPTTLVFKDGHQLEIDNYAIVSQTLYDLTSGHPRKIALADLDLPATEQKNDDRGVTFQLPPSAQAN
jgi:hypothetical protein